MQPAGDARRLFEAGRDEAAASPRERREDALFKRRARPPGRNRGAGLFDARAWSEHLRHFEREEMIRSFLRKRRLL